MKKSIVTTVFCLLAPFAHAAPPANTASAESVDQLMTLTNVDGMIQNLYGQMDQMMFSMAQNMGIQPSEQALFDDYMTKLSALIRSEITWDKLKEPVLAIYVDNFTQQEVNDMVAFFKTESGQSMVRKMPHVMQQNMQLSQQKMMSLMPQVRELALQFEQKVELARGAAAQTAP
jgi:hypothetical protein